MNDFVSSSTEEDKGEPTPVDVPLVDQSGRYRIGEPERPNIVHDNGFLDQFEPEETTAADRMALAKWRVKLDGASVLRRDLADATGAYRHFLNGDGEDRTISNYRDYLLEDLSGRIALESIKKDFVEHVEVIGQNREVFKVTSDPYRIGSEGVEYPYPATENWQKAIGGHVVWVSAEVEITYYKRSDKDWYKAEVTLHMEDMYNFNPGAADIATGIPDDENGRFEIVGLAHQYMNYGTYSFVLEWLEGEGERATPKEGGGAGSNGSRGQ